MKLNYTVLILISLIWQVASSQQMPIDFSDSQDNFTGFGGTGFSKSTDPEDANNTVGEFVNSAADDFEGAFIDLDRSIDLNLQQIISLSFYSFDSNTHTIILKLERGNNPDVEVTRSTNSFGWTNNIEFDFSDTTGIYNRLTIFIDGGVQVAGTYLIDNIDDGSEPTNPNELDVIYNDLVWADEFDTDGAIDSNNWFHQTQLPAGGSWFNGEQQHYTNRIENSFVDNGFLNISAIKESFTDQGETKQYTSARLNSKFAFTYGRVDVRAKLPFGDGTWPAIWTLGKKVNEDGGYWDDEFGTTNWPGPGEIDIMEHGLGDTNHVNSALHTPCEGCFGATKNFQSYTLDDVANNFHVYSMNWSPDQITFLIDGVGFYTYNPAVKDSGTWPYFEDQYLLLNIAMGGVAGEIDPNFAQSNMVIDYVRVYQNNTLGIDEVIADTFKIYPNPASDFIKIESQENIDKLELYNTLGQLVKVKRKETKILNVENLEPGFYILKIYSGNLSTTKRVVLNN